MADRFEIRGARSLVTGATGGLGGHIARALAGRGADLVVSGRRADALRPLADELGARPVVADLESASDVERLVDEAGPLDVLVLNAALPGSGAVLDYTPEQIERAAQVNLLAPTLTARRVAADMVARGRGRIVFVGSLSGLVATGGTGIYSMTKFGLRGLAHGLRQDLHGTGVGVSIVQPGFVRDAGMFADTGLQPPPGAGTVSPQQVVDAVLACIERGRAEVNVAPLRLRAGAHLAGLVPGFAAAAARRMGSDAHAAQFAERQKDKR